METVVCEAAEGAGVNLAENQKTDLAVYLNMLDRWNRKINLVSRKGFSGAVADRMFDALLMWCTFRPWEDKSHLDVGSGGGFPAIPIHIMSPGERLILMEPRRKRAGFLSAVASQLQFKNMEVQCERLDGESVPCGKFDVVTAQAVKPFEEMIALILPRLAGNGRFVWAASKPMSGGEREAIDRYEGRFAVIEEEHSRPGGRVCWIEAVEKCP